MYRIEPTSSGDFRVRRFDRTLAYFDTVEECKTYIEEVRKADMFNVKEFLKSKKLNKKEHDTE